MNKKQYTRLEKIKAYLDKTKWTATKVEIAKHVGISPQNLCAFLKNPCVTKHIKVSKDGRLNITLPEQ